MSQHESTSVTTKGPPTRKILVVLAVVGLVVVLTGLVLVLRSRARPETPAASATLRMADGKSIGRVDFFDARPGTLIRASIQVPAGATKAGAFHGFHIHANDDATNGNDCVANPAEPAKNWFVSADGHFDAAGHNHAEHAGDLDSLYLMGNGRGTLEFRTDRVSPSDLDRRVVIVHAGPDNFGNVPVGSGAQDYTPNSPAAKAATERTGNAGDRIACGVIEVR